jgi:hypothetical protein
MRANREGFALACFLAVSVATPGVALGRAWQGVRPGSTTESEVTAKFGPPSTQGKLSGRVALVYKGDQAIAGTRQAQFFPREDGVVIEVVVFPTSQLDREAVEGTYGRPTQKAFTDDFRAVWFFKPSGVTVYFGKDGFVDAVSFRPEPSAKPETSHPSAAPKAEQAPAPAPPPAAR